MNRSNKLMKNNIFWILHFPIKIKFKKLQLDLCHHCLLKHEIEYQDMKAEDIIESFL